MSELPINKIIHGDCLDVMKDWPDGCVDLVLTDPPYGIGYETGNQSPTGRSADIVGWRPIVGDERPDGRWLVSGWRVMKDGAAAYFNCRWDVEPAWRELVVASGLKLIQRLIWFKRVSGKGDLQGTFGPVSEDILFTSKGRHILNHRPGNILDVGCVPTWEYRHHPHQKPLSLLATLIEVSSTPGDLILDPFCGSGTTCVAAKMLGRDYIGIDISEEYCDIACKRLEAVDTGVPVKERDKGQIPLFGTK